MRACLLTGALGWIGEDDGARVSRDVDDTRVDAEWHLWGGHSSVKGWWAEVVRLRRTGQGTGKTVPFSQLHR